MSDLWRLDATAQAALVRAGEVSPGELLACTIERIEGLNSRVNAVITPLYDLARRQADERTGGPFDGVPLLLKDAGVEVAGTPQYLGTRLLRDLGYRSPRTDELGERLRRAGFVFAGKTNVPPLSAGVTTEPPAFGPTKNPWDLERSASGSSGGSAAAVAAGMTSIAHGADATGSLRFPASACGVATLKPSRGAVPSTPPAQEPGREPAGGGGPLDVWAAFVFSRSVRDLAGVFDAIATPGSAEPPPEALPRLRIGLQAADPAFGLSVHEECVAAVEAAGRALEGLGHRVEYAYPPALDGLYRPLGEAVATAVVLARAGQRRWLEALAGRPLTADDADPSVAAGGGSAAEVPPEQAAAAATAIAERMTPIVDWWRDYDVLVSPVLRRPPWPLGDEAGPSHVGGFASPFSWTGQPAMSLPLHWTAEGLPVGVQLVGAPRADRLLLALAAELEQAMPWADRWPAIATER